MAFDAANENLRIWLREEKTDPSATKGFTRGGGFRGTAINATYLVKRLTQAFGPVGWGWGYEVVRSEVVTGAPIASSDGTVLGHESVQVTEIRFWYYPTGRSADQADRNDPVGRAEFSQVGQTMLVSWSEKNRKFSTDEEAWKKSLTDAISKAASHIGIGADVHLGLFDDNKYVNDRKNEEAEAKKAAETKAKALSTAELAGKVKTLIDDLANITTAEAYAATRADALALRPKLLEAGMKAEEEALGNAVRAAAARFQPKAA